MDGLSHGAPAPCPVAPPFPSLKCTAFSCFAQGVCLNVSAAPRSTYCSS